MQKMIACITLNQSGLDAQLTALNLGPFLYPDPVNIESAINTIQRRKANLIIVDTASLSPEIAKDHCDALLALKDTSMMVVTPGEDLQIKGVVFVEKISEIRRVLH